jgi:hypothetical protein
LAAKTADTALSASSGARRADVERLRAHPIVHVALRARRQEGAEPHRSPVRQQIGEAEEQHRHGADRRRMLAGRRALKPGHHGERRDDPVIAAIDDLAQIFRDSPAPQRRARARLLPLRHAPAASLPGR